MVCSPHQYTLVKLASYSPSSYQMSNQIMLPQYTTQPSPYRISTNELMHESQQYRPTTYETSTRTDQQKAQPTYQPFASLLYKPTKTTPEVLEQKRDQLAKLIQRELLQTHQEVPNHVRYN